MIKHREIISIFKILCLFALVQVVIKMNRVNPQIDYKIMHTLVRIPHNESALSTSGKSLREMIKCINVEQIPQNTSYGKFFVFKNLFRATKSFECHDSITYVTHSDINYLHNVIPLLKRWNGPLSVAIYAPGRDFAVALDRIFHLRNCHEFSPSVRQLTTFHLFLDASFLNITDTSHMPSRCAPSAAHQNLAKNETSYPINTARNIARAAAATHYVLVSDIELYPNPQFIEYFFEMIASHEILINERNVFVLPVFEMVEGEEMPRTKASLSRLHRLNRVQWFHEEICSFCHSIPKREEWLTQDDMHVHSVVKRQGKFSHWEPIFVGTKADPFYDERLNWEGKSDKMTQAYIMCLLDYNFNVLTRGFLIHKPGIKSLREAKRVELEERNREIISKTILPEISFLYGESEKCQMST